MTASDNVASCKSPIENTFIRVYYIFDYEFGYNVNHIIPFIHIPFRYMNQGMISNYEYFEILCISMRNIKIAERTIKTAI